MGFWKLLWRKLTLDTCAKVMVVVLCVCVCVCVCYHASFHIPCLYVERSGVIRPPVQISMHVLCGFHILTMLRSKVLVTFAEHLYLLCFLTNSQWIKETMMVSFQED